MKGELQPVWPEAWHEIFLPMSDHKVHGDDLLQELYRDLIPSPNPPVLLAPPTILSDTGEMVLPEDIQARDQYQRDYADFRVALARHEEARNDSQVAYELLPRAFERIVVSEQAAIQTLEASFTTVSSFEDEEYSNDFFRLTAKFMQKFSLRYDLRRPYILTPTVQGIFCKLIEELKRSTQHDAHIAALLSEFEDAVRDLRYAATPGRIKTCLQKQFNLLEAMARKGPGVTAKTLGDMCDQLTNWPHPTVKEAMKKLYGFRSDYPGMGHGGNPDGVLRDIEMRDLVSITVLLAGFSPYLAQQLDVNVVYGGA